MLNLSLAFLMFLMLPSLSMAAGSIGYSGRLVNSNGSPVVGPVDLQFELAYSGTPSVIVCNQTVNDVTLTNGVFHVKLVPVCTGSFTDYLTSIPAAQEAIIRVTNLSAAPARVYSFQTLNSVPVAEVSMQLAPMGASNNEVLTWTGSAWEPKALLLTNGTVTEIVAGSGLSGGTINDSGTIAIQNGGVTNSHLAGSIDRTKLASGTANYVLVNDGSGVLNEVAQLALTQGGTGASTAAGARSNLGLGSAAEANLGYASGNALPADGIPVCLPTTKLQYTGAGPTYWSCVADYDTSTDATKLPLVGGNMSGAIDMGTNRITNLGAPVAGTDAATRDYVDSKTGGDISFTPIGNISATTLQGAITELDTEKEPLITAGTTAQYYRGDKTWSSLQTDAQNLVMNNYVLGTNAAIINTDTLRGALGKVQAQINALATVDTSKEPIVTAGTTAQYYRGDKSWQTLDGAAVANTAAGNISATNIQAAINELDSEKQAALGFTPVNKAGDTMSGGLNLGTNKITNLGAPTVGTDATTKTYVDAQVSTAANQWTLSGSDVYRSTGNVGIGTSTPAGKLQVNGTLLVKPSVSNATGTIDFSAGNLHHTSANCGAYALHNLKDGGTYTLAVKGATSATCTFTTFTDAGVTPITFHYPLGHGATIASKHTIYTFIVMGNDVYANWIPGL